MTKKSVPTSGLLQAVFTTRNDKKDPRFQQLLDQIRCGDEAAPGDLFLEFGINYEQTGGRYERV
jgi:hypothetical protein